MGRLVFAVLIAGTMLAVAVFSVLSGCEAFRTEEPDSSAAAHPTFEPTQSCTSCKDTAGHDYSHEEPFGDPDCASCHTVESWTRVVYTHANGAFDDGFHAVIGCVYCHSEKDPTPPADCQHCHDPGHRVVKPCATCHNANTWRILNPLPRGHVSLVGGHSELSCFSCHSGVDPLKRPRQCVDCHGKKHGGFTDCARCHDPSRGWKPKPGFDHDVFFRLTGRHTRLACAQCHPNNRFSGLGTACASCHGVKHGGLAACANCHTTAGFRPSTFRHSTRFVLSGAHARIACSKCHPSNRYADVVGPAGPCVGCHGSRHGGLRDCTRCHTTSTFRPSTFRHSSVFNLTGRHAVIACSKCHPSNRYAQVVGSKSACTNCHGVKHGNQRDCAKCHTTAGFVPAKRIAHPVPPPLAGEHAQRPCSLCHTTLVFNAPVRPCVDCHTAPHVGPANCLQCHTPTYWYVQHDDIGFHTGISILDACQYCHTEGLYPDHVCDQCHIPFD